MMAADLDQFRGALLGGAIGDALGAPLEGLCGIEIRLIYGSRVRNFLPERYGPGAFTGDTQLAIALAEALVTGGRFDMDEVSHAFAEWMRLHDEGVRQARGYDQASATACRRLYRGVSRQFSAVDSAGCGAATRAAPIGLLSQDEGDVLETAVLQAMLTHADPRALAGAATVAVGVAHALSALPFDAFWFLRATALMVEGVEPGLAAKISGLEAYVEKPIEEGLEYTETSHYAMEAVPAALLLLAKIPHHTEEAIVTAFNAGGDAAGIGAMVGAFAGALNGAESLPERWLDSLEARVHLEHLAETLYPMVSRASGMVLAHSRFWSGGLRSRLPGVLCSLAAAPPAELLKVPAIPSPDPFHLLPAPSVGILGLRPFFKSVTLLRRVLQGFYPGDLLQEPRDLGFELGGALASRGGFDVSPTASRYQENFPA